MTASGETSAAPSKDDGGALEFPEGGYTKVKVVPIGGGQGSLTNGTGTYSSFGTFSAGQFSPGDLPRIGDYYNISATHEGVNYDFPRWKCTHAGGTSDFREN
ncbi:hypothetical protein ACFFQW_31490 [Umezawaea endophytica]|uniref:Uncharacterized protein n=1 Tax=Umezawaea endophytica TaxID=1654476 RepID=A0A9X2VWQ0_9PSEU|nr:hypothetical protein [Umezawaea endophytica]MCS7484054.1 hypothetical protein [Umezawaea endophytica]